MSNFLEAARYTDRDARQPHQDAAWHWAWSQLSAEQQREFLEMFRAAPAGPFPLDQQPARAWLPLAEATIKQWEGLRLGAYPDPATGGEPFTIGYGCTYLRRLGRKVRHDDRILKSEAEEILRRDLLEHWAPELFALIPPLRSWPAHRIAALVSWAFNVGLGAVGESTLRARLLDREDPNAVIREELPRWNKAAGKVNGGLVKRRAAEVSLFCSGKSAFGEMPPPPAPIEVKPAVDALKQARGNPLVVPWFSQMDSRTDQARRMCFSSSCAMLVAFLRPAALSGANGDDQYLATVQRYGDTTDPAAQVRALAHYGVEAEFTRTASFSTIEEQIALGYPVPCGYLHRGPIDRPSGSGHWLIVVGHTPTHVVVHDPFAEMDLVSGESTGAAARYCHYSRKNFGRRWMVEGNGSGWAIVVRRLIGP